VDIITTITTALISGATAALKDTTSKSIKDAYAGLKKLITKKIKNKDQMNEAIKKIETEPQKSNPDLKKIIAESDVINDEQIFAKAESLLKMIHSSTVNTNIEQNINIEGSVKGDIFNIKEINTLNINKNKG